tara:strand:- start:85 stop:429 length:345 start_codon:yes stop_codon:yes gene_type:complete
VPIVDFTKQKERKYMKGIYEPPTKSPEEKLAIAKIQVMMEDTFGILSSMPTSRAFRDQAKNWFDTSDCAMWCDMAGTTQDRVKKLLNVLTERYNNGTIDKNQLRLGIRRLELKI